MLALRDSGGRGMSTKEDCGESCGAYAGRCQGVVVASRGGVVGVVEVLEEDVNRLSSISAWRGYMEGMMKIEKQTRVVK